MLSITALRARMGSGDLSPDGALALSREAIAAREDEVRAFVRLAEDAVAQAAGPLAGIAVAVKDIVDTAQMPTQMGSEIYEGWQPRADASVVAALKRAGATIIGKSETTAFASSDPARTRNPRAAGRTPGGSSAGSAASVGGGMVPLAIGTQTAGSVIRPASYCGAAAIKPSFRLIPTVGVKCLAWTLDTVGLFAATVPDLAVAVGAIAGRAVTEGRAGAPRLGIVRQDFAGAPEPEAEAALETAIARLSGAGAAIRDLAAPASLAEGWAAQPTIMNYESAQALAWEVATAMDRMPPKIAAALQTGEAIAPDAYDEARRSANRARREAKDLFRDVDAILTYSAPGIAPEGHSNTGDPRYNRLWTMLGTPCINVPGLLGPDDMPIGIQVVAPFARDALALDIAAFVEAAIAP